MNRTSLLGLLALVVAFALYGIWEESRNAAPEPPGQAAVDVPAEATGGLAKLFGVGDGAAAARVDFTRWTHPQGLFSAEVPAGWRIEGQVAPQGLDKGAFMLQGFAPDGRAMFSFAHNWLWFMEYQYGPYRPGHATCRRCASATSASPTAAATPRSR
jgi:hypothetical protein